MKWVVRDKKDTKLGVGHFEEAGGGKWESGHNCTSLYGYMKFKNRDSYNFKIIKLEIRMYFSSST